MIPAGAIPSVLGKRRMQTAEELVNSPGFHLGGGGGAAGLRGSGDGNLGHILV